jgi:hypothetical protein
MDLRSVPPSPYLLIQHDAVGIPDFAFAEASGGIIEIGGSTLFFSWDHFLACWEVRSPETEQLFGPLSVFRDLLPEEVDFGITEEEPAVPPEPTPDDNPIDLQGGEENG